MDYVNYHTMNTTHEHALDYSGITMKALDLSKKSNPEKQLHNGYTTDRNSPQIKIERDSPIQYQGFIGIQNVTSPLQVDSMESSTTESPQHLSPNSDIYQNNEQLNPYVLQAALHQQLLLKQNTNKKCDTAKKSGEEVVSDGNSDGKRSPKRSIYGLMTSGRDGKVTRPFKAYPKNPLSLAAGLSAVDTLLDTQSAEKFSAFRDRMLAQICAANGGQVTISNPKMRRTVNTNNNYMEDGKTKHTIGRDNSYTERRKKNNAAAKKSRDRRRIKEDEIAIRAAFLERENIELKFELAAARKQLAAFGIISPTNC